MITIDIVTSDGTWTHADCVRVSLVAKDDKSKNNARAPKGALSLLSPDLYKIILFYDTARSTGWQITLAEGLTEPQAHAKMKDLRTRILANETIHVEKEPT